MANQDLLSQHLPAQASVAISTTPVAVEMRKGGRITVTADVAFRAWFSDQEDGSIDAAAMSFDAATMPEFELRGASQKRYCLVACDSGTGTAKLLQE